MRRGSDAIALPKERSRLALRLAGLQLVRSIYAGWRHKCLIRPTFLPAGSPPGPASAAPPGSQTRALVASSILYLWLNRRAIR
ncbi:hypothetical protein, partial [Escherichia coli]